MGDPRRFHIHREDLREGSALDVDPPFASLDVVLRQDHEAECERLREQLDQWKDKAFDALACLRQANDNVEAAEAECGRLRERLEAARLFVFAITDKEAASIGVLKSLRRARAALGVVGEAEATGEGIDQDLFGTVCFERDQAQVENLRLQGECGRLREQLDAAHQRVGEADAQRMVAIRKNDERVRELDAAEYELRREWWLHHGHDSPALYGDDGELQCTACLVDYKRMPLDELRHVVLVARAALGVVGEGET